MYCTNISNLGKVRGTEDGNGTINESKVLTQNMKSLVRRCSAVTTIQRYTHIQNIRIYAGLFALTVYSLVKRDN
ncbi:hypothetical protein J6590_047797 [Homalodisca vitripennis]|nr:hypothetical protein J6590_047797 [Homalodisca vitripennis]